MALAGGCMSMLRLRQVPLRGPATRRFDWPSPTMVPRSWLTTLFTASAAYAVVMALVTNHPLHRTWGIFAACSYLVAAMLVLAVKSRGVDSALLVSLSGGLIVPLGLMAADRLQQPEVRVSNKSASLLWREPHPLLAGLAFGVAAAMKATAWPALLIVVVLVVHRDGRRAAGIMSGTALAVFAAIVGPVAVLGPNALIQNTIEFPLGLASIRSEAVSPLPGRLLVETGQAGHLIAVALLALACLGIIASLVFRPPRTVPAATWRVIIGLSLMFVLAPATRFGYFLYPAGLLAWLGISWLGSSGGGPPASGARSAKPSAQAAYQSANHGSPAASGRMYSTVCT